MAKAKAKRNKTKGKAVEPYGRLYEDGEVMFLRRGGGTAADEEGNDVFEMSSAVGAGFPIIRSLTTGRTFTLSWQDIIDMAIAAGIND